MSQEPMPRIEPVVTYDFRSSNLCVPQARLLGAYYNDYSQLIQEGEGESW